MHNCLRAIVFSRIGYRVLFLPVATPEGVAMLLSGIYLRSGTAILSMSSKAWFSPPIAQMKV
jgi:hypothetical protein